MAASKLRTMRTPDDGRWERAAARAESEGRSVSALLNDVLDRYAAGDVVYAMRVLEPTP